MDEEKSAESAALVYRYLFLGFNRYLSESIPFLLPLLATFTFNFFSLTSLPLVVNSFELNLPRGKETTKNWGYFRSSFEFLDPVGARPMHTNLNSPYSMVLHTERVSNRIEILSIFPRSNVLALIYNFRERFVYPWGPGSIQSQISTPYENISRRSSTLEMPENCVHESLPFAL